MKFRITRTSEWDDEPPCDGVYRDMIDYVEVRTLASEEEFDRKFGASEGEWRSKGTRHKINEEGYIQRTHPKRDAVWCLDINTLEEFMRFVEEHDCIVVANTEVPEIEIYDGYRE